MEDTGVPVRFPLDEKGADILLVTPSADFFAEPHIAGLIGYAKVFHQAGARWTMSSYASEAANFGFSSAPTRTCARSRCVSARRREDLGVKRIVFGECGHAWRVAYSFLNTLAGPFDFLDQRYPIPQHICEYHLRPDRARQAQVRQVEERSPPADVPRFMQRGARLASMGDKPGGQFEIPRAILRASCNHFYDMAPDTIKESTVLLRRRRRALTDDLIELRKKGAQPRMRALQQVAEEHGVTHMAAICAICKTQFSKVLPMYGFDMEAIVSVHQMVSNAIILEDVSQAGDGNEV